MRSRKDSGIKVLVRCGAAEEGEKCHRQGRAAVLKSMKNAGTGIGWSANDRQILLDFSNRNRSFAACIQYQSGLYRMWWGTACQEL